jgi:hypothetical protein
VYHRCGWSPRLPGFHAGRPDRNEEAIFLLRVELMSRFPRACASPWMARCLAHLDGFRTARGTWKLPAAYLADKPAGYWVLGAYMGLEDQRGPLALEVESTLRMAAIHRRADGAGIIDFHVKYDIIS